MRTATCKITQPMSFFVNVSLKFKNPQIQLQTSQVEHHGGQTRIYFSPNPSKKRKLITWVSTCQNEEPLQTAGGEPLAACELNAIYAAAPWGRLNPAG